jgi:hypothetical protein
LKPANNKTDPTTPHIGENSDSLRLAYRMVTPIQRKKSMNEKALIEEDIPSILKPESLADFEFLMTDKPKMIAHITLMKRAIKEATSAGGICENCPYGVYRETLDQNEESLRTSSATTAMAPTIVKQYPMPNVRPP